MLKKQNGILLITNKNDLSADLIILELREINEDPIRINLEDFPELINASWSTVEHDHFKYNGNIINLNKLNSVWYRRTPKPIFKLKYKDNNMIDFIKNEVDSFILGFLSDSNLFWINPIFSVMRAENKILQLKMAKNIGFNIPYTIISNDFKLISQTLSPKKDYIAKPISKRKITLDDKNYNIHAKLFDLQKIENLNSLQVCPIIIQERIKRKYEVRITIVGKQIFGCCLNIPKKYSNVIDIHEMDDNFIKYQIIDIPKDIAKMLTSYLKKFKLNYGCFDFIVTPENEWKFLELNPSGQWGWIEKNTGMPITKSIIQLLIEARSHD